MSGLEEVDSLGGRFAHIRVYDSTDCLLLAGWNTATAKYELLKIKRPRAFVDQESQLEMHLLPHLSFDVKGLEDYAQECKLNLLYDRIQAIFGLIKLSESFYLIVATETEVVASIHGHEIYMVTATAQIPVTYRLRNTSKEINYQNLLQNFQFAQNIYFSHHYPLFSNFQNNVQQQENVSNDDKSLQGSTEGCKVVIHQEEDRFIWNTNALDPLLRFYQFQPSPTLSRFIIPMIYGFVRQLAIEKDDEFVLRYTLIARRSRHFAGTRYLKRGANDAGDVANEVETEQLLTLETLKTDSRIGSYQTTSFTQIRGSIPSCWSHQNLVSPMPDVVLEADNDPNYSYSILHFHNLLQRYGETLYVLNLIRDNYPREALLMKEFEQIMSQVKANEYLNSKVKYYHFDLLTLCSNQVEGNQMKHLVNELKLNIDSTGICISDVISSERKDYIHLLQKQQGALRTNCVDCLDRTNVTQYLAAKIAVKLQLRVLRIRLQDKDLRDLYEKMLKLWEAHGDMLAFQYAGSQSMHRIADNGQSSMNSLQQNHNVTVTSNVAQNALIAIRRYYYNIALDYQKQHAIDLILGIQKASRDQTGLNIDLSPKNFRNSPKLHQAESCLYSMDMVNLNWIQFIASSSSKLIDKISVQGGESSSPKDLQEDGVTAEDLHRLFGHDIVDGSDTIYENESLQEENSNQSSFLSFFTSLWFKS